MKIGMRVWVDTTLNPDANRKILVYANKGAVVYWGDGTHTENTSSYDAAQIKHQYETDGQYVIEIDYENAVKIYGVLTGGFNFQDGEYNPGFLNVTKIEFPDTGTTDPFVLGWDGNNNNYGTIGCSRSSTRLLDNVEEISILNPYIEINSYQGPAIGQRGSTVDRLVLGGYVVLYNANSLFWGVSFNHIIWTGNPSDWPYFLEIIPGTTDNAGFFAAPVSFTVTYSYNTNGGTLQSGFDNPNTAASFPSPMPTCTKTGWTFAGWYKDPTFNTPVVAGTAIDVTTIYAKFAAAVTYSLNGGTNNALNPAAYTPTDVANARPLFAATKAGYDFAGWYTDSAFTNKVTNFGGFTGAAVTLYAKFEAQEKYSFKIKTGANAAAEKKLDAYTVRGRDGYVNENLSSLNNMGELLAIVTEINARNEHALFDASAFITGAYVCLIKMTESGTARLCEIHDLINNRVYLNDDGYALTDDIEDYIAACSVKTSYENIGVPSGMTMGELRTFINGVNSRGDHCFFDFSGYLDNAYVCTVLAYAQSAINYIFIFDILNGKVYGSYTGYTDAATVANYLSGNESDIVHAIKLTNASMTLSDMAILLNKINQLGHHVLFDVSTIASGKYLVTCVASVSGSNVTVNLLDIVSGKMLKGGVYAGTTKLTVALGDMADIPVIAGASALSLPYTAVDGTSGTFTIYGKITPNS